MYITREEFMKLLELQKDKLGNQKLQAAELGISEAFLSDVYRGKRDPSAKLLVSFGLESVTVYRKVKK